jgi:NAD(P)-dependent dehydrogenase (short-subunit alcohol dehydrogenase family)
MPIALVTGANSGIGRATAIGLAGEGVHVIVASRSAERAQPVLDEIAAFGGSAEYLELDLSSMTSVRTASQSFADTRRNLDILVNNAGIGVNRRGLTEDGFEVHFGINHLGHFLLTRELFPNLGSGSRVVALASAMHFRADGIDFARVRHPTAFIGLAEYATSKLANVLFTRELARRRPGIRAYAVHPGLVRTRLIPGPIRVLSAPSMVSPEQGADTVLWCATSEDVASESGQYYQRRTRLPPSAQAQDDDLARELWERSEEWCG